MKIARSGWILPVCVALLAGCANEPARRQGPVMTAALTAKGLPPDIIPTSPKMGALIVETSRQAAAALAKKRG